MAARIARSGSRAAAALLCTALAIAALMGASALLQMRSAASPAPQGVLGPFAGTSAEGGMEGWPDVDWVYWQGINEDICAWITVPGTSVNFPVLQAPDYSPELYLKHDIHGNYNPWGVPFLDADCAEKGILSSKVAWVYGHNMLDGSMFEPLTGYAEQAFMLEHPKVWIQTPDGTKRSYDVYAAEVLHGTEPVKRVTFKDQADFKSWRDMRYANAATTRMDPAAASRVLCLVTCSHNTWRNERTVVYCMASADAREIELDRR